MVSFLHKKHLANKYSKVGIFDELDLKAVIGGLLEAAPQIKNVVGDVQRLGLIVVH